MCVNNLSKVALDSRADLGGGAFSGFPGGN